MSAPAIVRTLRHPVRSLPLAALDMAETFALAAKMRAEMSGSPTAELDIAEAERVLTAIGEAKRALSA